MKYNRGFTLIELVVVIGILSILLAVTLIAVNPGRQFQQARDTQRSSDVLAILNAINQFSIDNDGDLPGDGLGPGGTDRITNSYRKISSTEADICGQLVSLYLAAFPSDPSSTHNGKGIVPCPASYDTEYTVKRSGNRVMIAAPLAEVDPLIEVSR